MKTLSKYILLTLILLIFFINIDIVINTCFNTSYIFITKVFVSVVPFIILSNILIYYNYQIFLSNLFYKLFNKLFKVSKNSIIVIISSILSSTPTNAIYIKRLLDNNLISIKEANNILTYTYNPSISFILGTIGYKVFNNIYIGLFILLFNYIYNILIMLYLKEDFIEKEINLINNKEDFFTMIKRSILDVFNTCLIMLGFMIIFSIIFNILNKYLMFNNILLSIISGLFEMSSIVNISNNIPINYKILIVSFIINNSGLSIIFQSRSILSDYKINIKKILLIKIIFSFIVLIIEYIVLLFII